MEDYYSRLKLRTLVGRSEILYFVRFFWGGGGERRFLNFLLHESHVSTRVDVLLSYRVVGSHLTRRKREEGEKEEAKKINFQQQS